MCIDTVRAASTVLLSDLAGRSPSGVGSSLVRTIPLTVGRDAGHQVGAGLEIELLVGEAADIEGDAAPRPP